MSAQNTALGPDARIFIGDTISGALNNPYAVIEGHYTDSADVRESTDTLSIGSKEAAAGERVFTCSFTAQRIHGLPPAKLVPLPPPIVLAQYAAMTNYYSKPLSLFPGSMVVLWIILDYAVTVAPEGMVYLLPNFLIEAIDGNWRVQGSKPQIIDIKGRTVGPFQTPDVSYPEAGVRNSDNF
jgi:hypothetical protein